MGHGGRPTHEAIVEGEDSGRRRLLPAFKALDVLAPGWSWQSLTEPLAAVAQLGKLDHVAVELEVASMQTSARPASSWARTIWGGSDRLWTPMPLIMSHLTEPSASSTSGPFPRPEPMEG